MKKLMKYSLLLLAGLSLTSCGGKDKKEESTDKDKDKKEESNAPALSAKDKLFNEAVALFEKMTESIKTDGMGAMDKFKPKFDALEKKAKDLGFDIKDKSTLSEAQQKKLKEMQDKMQAVVKEKMQETMKEGMGQ